MRIGSYTISDWLCDLTWRDFVKDEVFGETKKQEYVTIYQRLNSTWAILNTSCIVDDNHKRMYGVDIMFLSFNSKEDAKQYVDIFINKLCKLKSFL